MLWVFIVVCKYLKEGNFKFKNIIFVWDRILEILDEVIENVLNEV